MRYKIFLPALLVAFLFSSNLALAQEPTGPQPKRARTPSDYKLRTLKEIADLGTPIAEERDDDWKGEARTLTHGDLLPSRVKLIYKGSTRRVPKIKRDVISQWANKYAGDPQHYIAPYTTEVLFSEAGINHWLVVNNNTIGRLRQAVKTGEAVDLNLIRLGAYKTGGQWRWVLLVEDFAE